MVLNKPLQVAISEGLVALVSTSWGWFNFRGIRVTLSSYPKSLQHSLYSDFR